MPRSFITEENKIKMNKKKYLMNLLNGSFVTKKFGHALERIVALIPLYLENDFVTSSSLGHIIFLFWFCLLLQCDDNDLLALIRSILTKQ